MQNIQSSSSPTSKILWIALNALVWSIGMTLGFTLEDTISRVLYFVNDALWSLTEPVSNIISACVMGSSIGVGQTLLLRRSNPVIGWQWIKATLSGFVIATFVANIFGLHIFQQVDCFICIGFIRMPPEFLWSIGVWSTFGISQHTISDPITSVMLGFGVGFSQWFILRKQNAFSWRWIVWSIVGYAMAFLCGMIISISFQDVLMVGVTAGAIFGLITALPLSSQLRNYAKHQVTSSAAA